MEMSQKIVDGIEIIQCCLSQTREFLTRERDSPRIVCFLMYRGTPIVFSKKTVSEKGIKSIY